MKFAQFVLATASVFIFGAVLTSADTPTVEGVVNGNKVKGPLCANSQEIVKKMVHQQMHNLSYKEGKPTFEKPAAVGEDGKPKEEECVDICNLCKDPPKKEEKVDVPPEYTQVCVTDPPVVQHFIEHPCPPTDPEKEKVGCTLEDTKTNSVDSHAELQNLILNAELPSDVTAKLLALHLIDQDKVKLNETLNSIKVHSPFETQAPLKPVGFDNQSVAIMSYYNRYFSCKDNPSDLHDLKLN